MPFTSVEKAFCVLEYARTQSIKTVKRIFAQRFGKSALEKVPDKKQIWRWPKKFKEEGCLRRVQGSGRKSMSEETIDKIRQKVVNSPKKSLRRTSFETQIPAITVWRLTRKRLQIRPYKLQLLWTFLDCSQLFGEFCLPFLLILTFGQILLLCASNLLP